jgi:hypothetical protein
MIRALVAILGLSLASCTSTISYKGNCDSPGLDMIAAAQGPINQGPCIVTAEDYTIRKTVDKNGKVVWSFVPTKWYKSAVESSTGIIHDLIPFLGAQ